MKREVEQEIRDEEDLKEELRQESEESINEDFRNFNDRPGDSTYTEAWLNYKQELLRPAGSKEMPNLIHKDLVLSNVKGELPDMNVLAEWIKTSKMFFDVFSKKVIIGKKKSYDGLTYVNVYDNVFDTEFLPITDFLMADVYSKLSMARSNGDHRAAILEVQQNILKTIRKGKEEGEKKWGM